MNSTRSVLLALILAFIVFLFGDPTPEMVMGRGK